MTPIEQVRAALDWVRDEGAVDRSIISHNLWSLAFIAPLETAIRDWEMWLPIVDADENEERYMANWASSHPHAVALAAALLKQKNGEQP